MSTRICVLADTKSIITLNHSYIIYLFSWSFQNEPSDECVFSDLLEIFTKLKRNSVIEADPPELHFNGFEPGKDFIKILVRRQKALIFIFSPKFIVHKCSVHNALLISSQYNLMFSSVYPWGLHYWVKETKRKKNWLFYHNLKTVFSL